MKPLSRLSNNNTLMDEAETIIWKIMEIKEGVIGWGR